MTAEAAGLSELTALVRDCTVSGVARQAFMVRIDLLPANLARAHHLKLADEAIEPLMGADRARRHDLPHGRIVITWRGGAERRLTQVLDQLGHLLLDAPMDAPALPELARRFDLPDEGAALLATATSPGPRVEGISAGPDETAAAEPGGRQRAASRPSLDLAAIDGIETRLIAANVARFARRRIVCRLGARSLAPAWETRFLSVEELLGELAPDRNPYAEPWLFRRLTRIFDRRMLALLSGAAELRDAGPFGLDLNVGGVLSPEFLRFDAALPPRLRGQTVLNLHPADVMSDLPGFHFACAFARARGHRILLRGVTPPLLPLLDLASLDLDFVELRWSPSLAGADPTELRAGDARWLLSRADTPSALRWGSAAGIGLFQGDAAQPGAGLDLVRSAA